MSAFAESRHYTIYIVCSKNFFFCKTFMTKTNIRRRFSNQFCWRNISILKGHLGESALLHFQIKRTVMLEECWLMERLSKEHTACARVSCMFFMCVDERYTWWIILHKGTVNPDIRSGGEIPWTPTASCSFKRTIRMSRWSWSNIFRQTTVVNHL